MTAEFWDSRAKRYDDAIQKHGAAYDQTIMSVRALLSTSDVVLDLGCASGEYSLDIAPFVRRVHGIDPSTQMIALALKKASDRAIDNATFEVADIFNRSLDVHHYTAVLAFSVLHLVQEVPSVTRRVSELLPPGGLLISETPCLRESGVLFKMFVGLAQTLKVAPPMLRLASRELEAGIAATGFDIAESKVWDRRNAVHWIVARKR